ncbi:hypothetical protein THAOC_09697 [Thalassiosira oceanica]|uniref:Uncharacterized protein n=1 Tax=Thalassiosira oceanica TaxID=159749 RepID=K0TEW9_THAOC|nr:hypothetical protein THAOC_09697 [Thalassiosira oceanica]|eukprot:EJK69077.1 hypothetical protein THAOC_09697 [Thalassiosira oceanica]
MADELAKEIVAQSRPRVRAVSGCITIKKTPSFFEPSGIKITAKCVNNEPEVHLTLSGTAGQAYEPLKYRNIDSAVNFVKEFIEAGTQGTHSVEFVSLQQMVGNRLRGSGAAYIMIRKNRTTAVSGSPYNDLFIYFLIDRKE